MYATQNDFARPRPSLQIGVDKPLLKGLRVSQSKLPRIRFTVNEDKNEIVDSESQFTKI